MTTPAATSSEDAAGRVAPALVGVECASCGTRVYPALSTCYQCLGDDLKPVELSDRGVLYSYSIVHIAPEGWSVPYAIGYVDLDDGVRVLGHLIGTDVSSPRPDLQVRYAGSNHTCGEMTDLVCFRPNVESAG